MPIAPNIDATRITDRALSQPLIAVHCDRFDVEADREALLFRQFVPAIPGCARGGQNEQGNGDKNGIKPDAPRGIVQNQSDERCNGNG